jgi:hypothetical protein
VTAVERAATWRIGRKTRPMPNFASLLVFHHASWRRRHFDANAVDDRRQLSLYLIDSAVSAIHFDSDVTPLKSTLI